MKRSEITEIFPDATKEQLDKLMSLNGADINAAKGDLEDVRAQLTAARGQLDAFKASAAGGQDDKLKEAQDALAAAQAELDGMKAREAVRTIREKVSTDKAVPVTLLTGETEEECSAQAEAIIAFAKQGKYPEVKDSGEATPYSAPTAKDVFVEWAQEKI